MNVSTKNGGIQKMTCNQCGTPIKEGNIFCANCGQVVPNSDITEDDLACFVGNDVNYYLNIWRSIDAGKRTWSWMAFIFSFISILVGSFWFGYRKMYGYLFIYLAIATLLDLLIQSMALSLELSIVLVFIWSVIVGFFAHPLYYRMAQERIRKIKSTTIEPSLQQKKIVEAGGTTWWGFGVAFLGVVAFKLIEVAIKSMLQ